METFRYPQPLKWLSAVAVPVFLGLSIGSLVMLAYLGAQPVHALASLTFAALFGWSAIAFMRLLQRVGRVLLVDGEGINVESGNGASWISWREIADVRAHAAMQMIVLYDYQYQPLLELDYQITGFDRLRERILEHTRPYRPTVEHRAVYRTAPFYGMLRNGSLTLLAATCYWIVAREEHGIMWLSLAVAAFALAAWLWRFRSYHIESDRLVMRAPLRTRELRYADISEVELRMRVGATGQAVPTVLIHRGGEQEVILQGIEEGGGAFVAALRSAWQRQTGDRHWEATPQPLWMSVPAGTNSIAYSRTIGLWLVPLCLLAVNGYQRLDARGEGGDGISAPARPTSSDEASAIAPLPPPATTVDDTLFRPVMPPAVDPFGYPALTVDRRHVTALLAAGRYDALEELLSSLLLKTRADIRNEYDLLEAYSAFDRTEPELETQLAAWLAARPGSSAVRFARAEYYLARAWQSRGFKYLRDTSPEQIEGMVHFSRLTVRELEAGLALDSANLVSYLNYLNVLRMHGAGREERHVRDRALRIFPTSFAIRSEVMNTLQPRWGGSYRQMDRFAEQAERYAEQNPRLLALRGYSLADRGRTAYLDDDYAAAVYYYSRALEHGPHWTFYLGRGRSYYWAKDYARALEDFVHVANQQPQDADMLELKGKTLYWLSAAIPPGPRKVAIEQALADFELLHAIQPTEESAEWLKFLQNKLAAAR